MPKVNWSFITVTARLNKKTHTITTRISRTQSTAAGEFGRFNLPFELGLDRGAQLFGTSMLQRKRCLILDAQPFDYRRALSDLSGVDIKHHKKECGLHRR